MVFNIKPTDNKNHYISDNGRKKEIALISNCVLRIRSIIVGIYGFEIILHHWDIKTSKSIPLCVRQTFFKTIYYLIVCPLHISAQQNCTFKQKKNCNFIDNFLDFLKFAASWVNRESPKHPFYSPPFQPWEKAKTILIQTVLTVSIDRS